MKWNKINESIEDTNRENYNRLYKIVMAANDCIEALRGEIRKYADTGKLDCEVAEGALETYHKTIDDNPVVNHQMDESIDDESGWFDEYGNMVRDLPPECISACSHSGSCDDDVAFWVDELEFDKGLPVNLAKRWLKATGGWTDDEVEAWTTRDIAERVLWIVCGNLKEDPDNPIYLGDY